jgi:hypothetical protein
MKYPFVFLAACLFAGSALAKLPPLSDEAKAKAAEAAAKTAYGGKVEAYLLCKSMDKTAAYYYKTSKSAGKDTKPPAATPACADPGPMASAAGAPAAAPAPAAAKPAAPAKKKS